MMARQVSRPMKSASSKGPMGWFIPRRMMPSMASLVATPSRRASMASLIMGMRRRLEMKPG